MPSTELVFGYGSNMDLTQMKQRCPNSELQPFVAEARGWRLCFPRKSQKRRDGVGSIVRSAGKSVWGVVFHLTAGDLAQLDGYEGVLGGAYHREIIEVFSPDGMSHTLWTYFAVPQDNPAKHYPPHRAYIALYIAGAEHFQLPPAYIGELRQITTINS